MAEQSEGKKRYGKFRRVALWSGALALVGVTLLYFLLNVFLNTPQGIGRISRLLSDTLHQPASIQGVTVSGGTITVNGLTVTSPRGFTAGQLLTARSISVAPAWGALLTGHKSFSSITIRELNLTLFKNSSGEWNFSGLKQLATGTKGGTETVINRLVLDKASITVNGRGVTDLSLTINDFSTRGSTDSGVLLSFRDDYGGSYRLTGSARLGTHPDLDLTLVAQHVPFKILRGMKIPLDPEKGEANLLIKAKLHENDLRVVANANFAQLALRLKGDDIPLSGALDMAGAYDLRQDTATLDKCSLQVNDVIRLNATGRMDQVKQGRLFTLEVGHDGVALDKVASLLPVKLRRDLAPGGVLLPSGVRIAGKRAAITSGHAAVSLRHGRLAKGGRLLADGVAADAALDKDKDGWVLAARVSQEGKSAGVPVEFRAVPLSVRFTERLRPVVAEIPSLDVRAGGIPIRGEATYRRNDPVPVKARLELTNAPLTLLTKALPVKDMAVTSGAVTATVRAAGRGPRDMEIRVVAGIKGVQGTYAGKGLALASLSATANVAERRQELTATGSVKAGGGLYDGKRLAASFAWQVAGGNFRLSGGDLVLDRAQCRFAEIRGRIPRRSTTRDGSSLPLDLRFGGIQCLRDNAAVDGLAGELRGSLITTAGGRRLEGEGRVEAPNLSYAGKGVGSLAARFALVQGKGSAELTGNLLDGKLAAAVNGDPFAAQRDISFTMNLTGAAGGRLGELLGKERAVRVSNGSLSAAAAGSFSNKSGLRCSMTLLASGLALAGKDGKHLLKGGEVKLSGAWDENNLLLREGTITIAKGPALLLHGSVEKPLSADRAGDITLSLPETPLAGLADAFADAVPKLREAAAEGTVAAKGVLRIRGKEAGASGEMTLAGASLEVPGQKLSITGIDGTIPVSLDFAGKDSRRPDFKLVFTRENYQRLLTAMQTPAKGGDSLTIGKIRFGTTEFAATTVNMRAVNGLTEIASMSSGLFHGTLLGRGYVRYQNGMQFGADILIHDLSLRELCNSYPAIKGYLSGRVDGFLSLFGGNKGLNDLEGLLEIWTRSSKEEKMLVSKDFLQKLAGKKFRGLFFQNDRPFDRGEISAYLERGDLTFETLDISHTNFLGIRDLSVSVAPVQNKIGLDHLLATIREAATRGKAATGAPSTEAAPLPATTPPPAGEFKWEE